MTRDEALKLLRGGPEGVEEWNRRRSIDESIPSLAQIDLELTDLACVDFAQANLCFANLRTANLAGANLSHADLAGARLTDCELRGANLSKADLSGADLSCAKLFEARLEFANLTGTIFRNTNLVGTWFSGNIVACDLSQTFGLEQVVQQCSSIVSVSAVLHFKDELPQEFLRGCGLRDEEIAYFRSVVGKPIRFYSCFISYSTRDEEFASRLHNDFQAKGIRCWKWDHDARTGRSIWGEIDQAIRVHDKVVLIASESSLKSPAVNREIERAIQEEDRRMKDKHAGKFDGDIDVLFPVRVDDYVLDEWQHERKADVVKKVIADARHWDKDEKVYRKVRDKLIKDLKLE